MANEVRNLKLERQQLWKALWELAFEMRSHADHLRKMHGMRFEVEQLDHWSKRIERLGESDVAGSNAMREAWAAAQVRGIR